MPADPQHLTISQSVPKVYEDGIEKTPFGDLRLLRTLRPTTLTSLGKQPPSHLLGHLDANLRDHFPTDIGRQPAILDFD